MTRRQSQLFALLLLACMYGLAALVWPWVPERVPTRWWGDVATHHAARGPALLALPVLGSAFLATLTFVTRARTEDAALAWVCLLVVAALSLAQVDQVVAAFGYGAHPSAPLSALLMCIGYVLPSLAPSGLVGVRTKWTFASDRAWLRSNRLAGRGLFGIGLASLIAGAAGVPHALLVSVGAIVLLSLVAFAYSYWEWRRDPQARPTD